MLWWDRVAPLGNPVVPEVYWMLIGSSGDSAACRAASSAAAGRIAAAAVEQAVPLGRPDQHHRAQVRAVAPDLLDHRRVVGGLELPGRDQQRDPGLLQHVLQLMRAVAGVDVDQDRADLGRGVLQQRPLGHVRRPDPHPVALGHAVPEQAQGQRVDVGPQLRVGPPPPGRHVDQRLPPGTGRDRPVEVVADGLAEQGRVGRAGRVGRQLGQGRTHVGSSSRSAARVSSYLVHPCPRSHRL